MWKAQSTGPEKQGCCGGIPDCGLYVSGADAQREGEEFGAVGWRSPGK